MPIALILTLLVALIGQSTDEGGDFLLSHTDEHYTHRFPQPLVQHLFKRLLTSFHGFDIVLLVSHWYPPGYYSCELYASSGYQTLILHTTQYTAFEENELNEKLRNIGLEGIEIRPPEQRFFLVPGLQPVIIREIHDRIFPTVAFSERDHAKKQRRMGKKWISQKNDALSVYTFATWGKPGDVFVSADYDDIIEKKEKLYAPYTIWVARPMGEPTNPEGQILKSRREEIPGHVVIPGQILDPNEAERYLREQLEG